MPTSDSIEKAIKKISDDMGMDAASVVLLVKLKRGSADRGELIGHIARERGEPVAEVRKSLKGWVPGVLVRAEASQFYQFEGDDVLTDGTSYEFAGSTDYPTQADLVWGSAQIIDENGEAAGPPTLANLVKAAMKLEESRRRRY